MPRWMRKHNRYPAVRRAREPWTKPEHELFMEAVFQLYGCNWRLVTQHIKTRRREQVRSHAQKIFEKMRAQGESHLIPPRCSRKRAQEAYPEAHPEEYPEEYPEAHLEESVISELPSPPSPTPLPDFFPPLEEEEAPQPIDIMSFFKDDAFY